MENQAVVTDNRKRGFLGFCRASTKCGLNQKTLVFSVFSRTLTTIGNRSLTD